MANSKPIGVGLWRGGCSFSLDWLLVALQSSHNSGREMFKKVAQAYGVHSTLCEVVNIGRCVQSTGPRALGTESCLSHITVSPGFGTDLEKQASCFHLTSPCAMTSPTTKEKKKNTMTGHIALRGVSQDLNNRSSNTGVKIKVYSASKQFLVLCI